MSRGPLEVGVGAVECKFLAFMVLLNNLILASTLVSVSELSGMKFCLGTVAANWELLGTGFGAAALAVPRTHGAAK